MKVAHTFDEEYLFDTILETSNVSKKSGNTEQAANVLNNRHANTTIPKFVGAINRCLTLKEENGASASESEQKKYLEYCKAFWELVTQHPLISQAETASANTLARMIFLMQSEVIQTAKPVTFTIC